MDYLENIEAAGFIITKQTNPNKLSTEYLNRYKNNPAGYIEFLNQFETIINPEETVWFNSIEVFNGETDTDFAWNAFEQISLEALEGDDEEIQDILDFWDNQIPILLSVKEYEYLAICLTDENYGTIVHGVEPELEETSIVCSNFNELMSLMRNASNTDFLKFFV